ncbi:MAG: AI-2E family transporter [Bryobacteraceae bacterium]
MWVTLGLLAALTAYLALQITGPYLEPLLAGAGLAALFHPLHLRLQKYITRPSRAAVVSTLLVTTTVVVPFVFLVTAIIRALQQSDTPGAEEIWSTLDQFSARVGMAPGELQATVQARFQEAAATLLRGSISAAAAAGGGVIQFIVSIGAFHFSLLHGPWLCDEIVLHSPLGRIRTATLLNTIEVMVRASFYGVVAVAAAQGILLAIGAWIAGLPAPAIWGLVTMIVSVIPLVGSALVWIPGAILLLAQGKIGLGLFFLAWSAALVANADNFVRPLIMMAALPVSGLLVFIAILGGIQAFGLIGIFAGPVTLAFGQALLRMLREEAQAAEELA